MTHEEEENQLCTWNLPMKTADEKISIHEHNDSYECISHFLEPRENTEPV